MPKCLECGKELGRITASHVKTHGMTYEDYQAKYEPDKLAQKKEVQEVVKFFNDFYITLRKKYLLYPKKISHPITVNVAKGDITLDNGYVIKPQALSDYHLQGHLTGGAVVGIHFPMGKTKVIGFDIDIPDTDLLCRLHEVLIQYGIPETAILMSHSGSKGYHVDVFLDSWVSRDSVSKFYKIIIKDLLVLPSVIELRGGVEELGYKLPLGYHQKTNAFCFICNENGERVINYLEVLRTRTKADKDVIAIVTEVFEDELLEESELKAISEVVDSVTIPEYTAEGQLKNIQRLLLDGVQEVGYRNKSIFKVALYLKDYENLSKAECIRRINEWIASKWSSSVIDKPILEQAKQVVKSVYDNDTHLKFERAKVVSAKVSTRDLKEILTVKTNNKLQTQVLRKMYYVLLLHSRLLGGGVFYMTYERMTAYGLSTDRRRLKQHVEKLAELGKVEIIRQGESREKGYKKLPNQYNLPLFDGQVVTGRGKLFTLCGRAEKCSNCFERAACYLLSARERSEVVKGKEFKAVGTCPDDCNKFT